MKTIEYKGKVYQVGAVYEFSEGGKAWFVDTLEDICPASNYPYKGGCDDYKLVRVYKGNLGTVEDAPVKLIDGECYQYEDNFGNNWKGCFVADQGRFWNRSFSKWRYTEVNECTNIKRLVVENSK